MWDPLETLKKLRKKVSQSRNCTKIHNCTNKILVKSETRTHVLLLGRPQKILINLFAQLTLEWKSVEASL